MVARRDLRDRPARPARSTIPSPPVIENEQVLPFDRQAAASQRDEITGGVAAKVEADRISAEAGVQRAERRLSAARAGTHLPLPEASEASPEASAFRYRHRGIIVKLFGILDNGEDVDDVLTQEFNFSGKTAVDQFLTGGGYQQLVAELTAQSEAKRNGE